MRGTVSVVLLILYGLRITPAHAGNSPSVIPSRTPMKDHPRTCGEQAAEADTKMESRGSPPHMRGTGPLLNPLRTSRRITPAHAGNRLKRSRISALPGFILCHFHSVCNKPDEHGRSPAKPYVPPDPLFQNAEAWSAVCNFPFDEAFSAPT